ncbi:MAG: YcfL family protein [Planctomycetota bacterium]
MRHLGGAVLGLALVLGAAACQSKGTSQDTYLPGEEWQKIEGVSGISDDLEMQDIRSERRDDRLHVQFELHNTRGSNLAFEWNAVWFDDSGYKIDWPDHWRPVSIPGKGFEILHLVAPTPQATSWRLYVQKPNTVD